MQIWSTADVSKLFSLFIEGQVKKIKKDPSATITTGILTAEEEHTKEKKKNYFDFCISGFKEHAKQSMPVISQWLTLSIFFNQTTS